MAEATQPIVRFYRLIEEARPPQRADRSALGTMPTRAFRYCEAAASAAGFGWYVFSPIDLKLIWDGEDIFWHHDGAEDWMKLMPSTMLPGYGSKFDDIAPEALQGFAPPFLTALPEAGSVQLWTGLIARTAPDWHLLMRAPANLPMPGGYAQYEGIVETDRWFGPLITNIRLTRTNNPVYLRSDFPLLQVQPLRRDAYSSDVLASADLCAPMQPEDWESYRVTVQEPNLRPDRPFGAYAAATRKQRKCPMDLARSSLVAA